MSLLLIVDDEPNIAYTVADTLGSNQLRVISAGTAREGLEVVRRERPDAVLLDVRLPDMSGLDLFDQLHAIDERMPVIIMTAYAKTDTAIEAMRRGAFDYFVKPVDLNVLRRGVQRAIEVSRLSHVPSVVEESTEEEDGGADYMVGRSTAMQEVYKTIGRVAQQDVTVLIQGESGTGKELAARAIYHYSHRNQKPFLAVNCAALPEALLESELFGHEKGAFTGADHRRIGKFEQVNGGTIFLDEIGDMTPSTQAKALRLLQQQQFERVGGNETIQTDVRIIAATNRDLPAMVSEGKFRQDLYYRLSGFTLQLPPLSARREDIPLLTDYFLRALARESGRPSPVVTPEVREALLQHSWPGNIRELSSAIQYAALHASGEIITLDCLPPSCRGQQAVRGPANPAGPAASTPGVPLGSVAAGAAPPADTSLPGLRAMVHELWATDSTDIYRALLQVVDRVVLEEALKATRGNQLQAAERLGISRMTLRSKLRLLRDRLGEDLTADS